MDYKGSDMGKRDLVCYIILDLGLDVGLGKGRAKNSKNMDAPELAYGYQKS